MRVLLVLMAALLIALPFPAMAEAAEPAAPSGQNYVLADGYIYYCVAAGNGEAILRMRRDATGSERLAPGNAVYLCVDGDRLYAVMDDGSLLRMGVDGGAREALVSGDFNSVEVANGRGYLAGAYQGVPGVYALDLGSPGAPPQLLRKTDGRAERVVVCGGWIYFQDTAEADGSRENQPVTVKLMRVREDGTDPMELPDAGEHSAIELLGVRGGRLYYNSGKATRSIALDGTNPRKILSKRALALGEDCVYFQGKDGLRRASLEGNDKTLVAEDIRLGHLFPCGDWLFYHNRRPNELPPYMMRPDGSASRLVPGYEQAGQ